MLERARVQYDLVVIDTPPLAAVSDAFPLLGKVDGVIIVGRVGRNRRDVAERLHETLMAAGAPLLGVVANGVKGRRQGSSGFSYEHGHAPAEHPSGAEVSRNGASANGVPALEISRAPAGVAPTNGASAQHGSPEGAPAYLVPGSWWDAVHEEPVRTPPRPRPPTYGEAVDLAGCLGDLPGEPMPPQKKRFRRRREASRNG